MSLLRAKRPKSSTATLAASPRDRQSLPQLDALRTVKKRPASPPSPGGEGEPSLPKGDFSIDVTDLEDARLAAEVERNNAALLRFHGRCPWVELHEDNDVVWLFSGDSWPRNSVALARFTPKTANRRVGEILAHHLKQKVACNWVIGSCSAPADLPGHLRAHGFTCIVHCAAMARELDGGPPALRVPVGASIKWMDEPTVLEPLTTELRRLRYRARAYLIGLKPRRIHVVGATVDGKTVGETTLFISGKTAGIYGVRVLEKFRRRGIGEALVRAALARAQELGCRRAVLGASGMGRSVYERAGFRSVGKLSYWKYGKLRQLRR
jgi:GNAT superfamily N-acetyltransferase